MNAVDMMEISTSDSHESQSDMVKYKKYNYSNDLLAVLICSSGLTQLPTIHLRMKKKSRSTHSTPTPPLTVTER